MPSSGDYSIKIDYKVQLILNLFYKNVSIYHSSWDKKSSDRIINYIYDKLFRRDFIVCKEPILDKWKELQRIRIDKWNFAIKIEDNIIHIVDACHSQNMSNHIPLDDDEEEHPYANPRITNIRFIKCNNDCFGIKCNIDGEEQLMERVTKTDTILYRCKKVTDVQLAEKYFKHALDQNIDLDHLIHFKR